MAKYEYARKEYRNYHNFIIELNGMGSKGWEVIKIETKETNDYDMYYRVVYFKRIINEK